MLSFFHPFLSKVTHDDEYRDQQSARDADSNDQHFFAVFIFRVEDKRNFLFTNGTTAFVVLIAFANRSKRRQKQKCPSRRRERLSRSAFIVAHRTRSQPHASHRDVAPNPALVRKRYRVKTSQLLARLSQRIRRRKNTRIFHILRG